MCQPLSQSLSQLDRSALGFVGDEERDINFYNYQREAIKLLAVWKPMKLLSFAGLHAVLFLKVMKQYDYFIIKIEI